MKLLLFIIGLLFSLITLASEQMDQACGNYQFNSNFFKYDLVVTKSADSYFMTLEGTQQTKCSGELMVLSEDGDGVNVEIKFDSCATHAGFDQLEKMFSGVMRLSNTYSFAHLKIYRTKKDQKQDLPHMNIVLSGVSTNDEK